jgi:hypothetical protein
MTNTQYNTTINDVRSAILNWLKNQLSADQFNWLKSTGETLKNNPEDWELFISFSSVPRHTGKDQIELTDQQIESADALRNGWDPSNWTVDQLGRTYLILCYADNGKEQFFEKMDKIFNTSDLGESVALYQSLPILPYPEDLTYRAAEGVRSNITTVFNAVALNNPYPMDYLDEEPWNQIVLKALFVESPLYKIMGLDDRANKPLAKMLVEYAHERISAGREVSPELWRPVGPIIDEEIVSDIKWLMNQPDDLQKQAGILAIRSGDFTGKKELLKEYQEIAKTVDDKKITWDNIGEQYHANK